MLFIIQNLPLTANIPRIKQLISDKCNISDVIVDNLIKLQNEGQATKQVTIGLADSSDAAVFVKNINGLFIDGHQLYVEDVRQKKQSEYAHCPKPSQISSNSVSHPFQYSLAMRRSTQVPPVPIPPMQMPVQFPKVYSNMPFYMTPVESNSAQRSYVGNNTTAPLVNISAQAPFYQQDSRFQITNEPDQNQWRAQAISYPILGFNQKIQDLIDVRPDSLRKQESNWCNKNEGLSQSASVMNIWNSPQNFNVTQNDKLTQNEQDIRQHSPRDRSPRDRSPGEHCRDHPLREHSSRDRVLRRRSPRERSRDRDYRRGNDSQSRNRFSRADRSLPRSRRDGRDMRDRDGKLDNRQDERSRRLERPQRPKRLQRPERPQRSERPERPHRSERSENDNYNRGYNNPKTTRDVYQNLNNQKRDFTPNLRCSDPFQQYPAQYSDHSENGNHNRDFDYHQPPCDVDHRTNQNINYQQPELPHSELFTQKSVFQLTKIASMYDPDPREPSCKKMRVTENERPHFNKQFNNTIPVPKLSPKIQPKFGTRALQEAEGSLSAKLLKQSRLIKNAAKILSKQIILKVNGGVVPNNPECLANLQKCITSRIDVVLGDCFTNTIRDIILAYRAKFSEDDDPGFFKAIIDKIERDSKESMKSDDMEAEEILTPDVQPGPSNVNNLIPNPVRGKFKLREAKRNANFDIECAYKSYANNGENDGEGYHLQNPRLNISKPSDTTKRLPSFPQGDKQVYKDQKKLQKLELHQEIYTLEPKLKKALDDEMVLLCKEYTSACEEPTDDKRQYNIHEKITNQILPEFKKIVQLHVTKRLLNIPNNLVIRIFSHPKPPKRVVIDEFLKNYDVASLKKTEKKYQTFFLVTCASYKSYDEILKLGKYKVSDACTLQFRPMHLIGPKHSGNPPKLKRGKSNIPPENIIPLDEVEELLEESNMDMENLKNDEIEPNIDQDEDNNENLNENILDRNSDIGKDFTNDDFTCDEFTNWNDMPRLDDSDVILLEKEHDIVVIDDNDTKITETLDDEDNCNEASNNDAKEKVNETAENNDGLDQSTNVIDEGTIEGVDVNEDDLEDF